MQILRVRFPTLLLASIVFSACSVFSLNSDEPVADLDHDRSTEFGGLNRHYLLHLPEGYQSNPQPLLIVLHGGGMTGGEMRRYTQLDHVADELGFIVAYPDAIPDWAEGCNCSESDRAGVDDIGFFSHLINEIDEEFGVIRSQVVIAGFSQGGQMAFRVACESGTEVASVAVVGATMSIALSNNCSPSTRVPLIFVMGTEDRYFPWDPPADTTNRWDLSAEETISFWASTNGCSGDRTAENVYTEPISNIEVWREVYETCFVGGDIDIYRLERGGHTWPTGEWSASWTIGRKLVGAADFR